MLISDYGIIYTGGNMDAQWLIFAGLLFFTGITIILSQLNSSIRSDRHELEREKEKFNEYTHNIDKELKEEKNEINKERKAVSEREFMISKLNQEAMDKLNAAEMQNETAQKQLKEVEIYKQEIEKQKSEMIFELSRLTESEAKEIVFTKIHNQQKEKINGILKQYKNDIELHKKRISADVLLQAMQNLSGTIASDHALVGIEIATEDIKGRLIGKEGRNIKMIENIYGVNLIIDDTPGMISISTFNPIRREIARLALTTMISSGRINQVTIEQEYQKAENEIEELIFEKANNAMETVGVYNLEFELVKLLGQLHFRSSSSQNVLQHSIEVAIIAKSIASELGLDPLIAARAGLLHDIGKVDSYETGKSHVELGIKHAQKNGESSVIINAIAAHHGDVEPTSEYAILVMIADSISASREGSRKLTAQNYIERIDRIENIALAVPGVSKAYALQGGRELRVIIEPEETSRDEVEILVDKIKDEIEQTVGFPGTITINAIRELKVTAEASKSNLIK